MANRWNRRALGRHALFAGVTLAVAREAMVERAAAGQATPEPGQTPGDPLPSWADGPLKQSILAFMAESVTEGSPGFLPPAQRIATVDIDGTLICEYPAPLQAWFAVDIVRQIGEADPEAARGPVFKRVLSGEFDDLTAVEPAGFVEVFNAANGGMTQQRFIAYARRWLEKAVSPVTGKRFIDMVYQPQLELLELLRASGFTIFLVSAGSVDVVRGYATAVFDIPTWHVIGTSYDYEFAETGDEGQVIGTSEVVALTNKADAIGLHVGQRPAVAIGNSDADLPMIQYANGGPTPALIMFVHHTDAEREYAYDRTYDWSPFDVALDAAATYGIPLVDMRSDWLRIWPEASSPSLLDE